MRVRDASNWHGNNGVRYASLANAAADAGGMQPDLKMAYAAEGSAVDPYAGFETRMVPENVTLLPKTKEQATGGNPSGERVHVVKKGDTVISVLRDQGATPEEAKSIAATLGPYGRDGGLKEGEKLRILMAPAGPGQRLQPYRVIVANDSTFEAVAALSDIGKYVAVDVQSMNSVTETADNSEDDDDDGTGVRLYESMYETALRNKVPPAVIEDMIRIYSYDVDFQRKVQAGDSLDGTMPAKTKVRPAPRKMRCCSLPSPSAARPRNTIASRPPTTRSSTTTTRAARARKSSWCGSRSTMRSCARASVSAVTPSSVMSRCTPASTGPRPTARRFSRPATASSEWPAGKAAMESTSAEA